MRSADTTGPIVVSDACSAIGPSAESSALTISAPLPEVGSSVLPLAADGDGAADPAGAPDPLGAALPEAAALEAADGDVDGADDGDGAVEGDGAVDADG